MKKFLLVFKHELRTVMGRRSYILTLLLLPLIGFAVTYFLGSSEDSGAGNMVNQIFTSPSVQGVEGFVDASGLVKVIPEAWKNRLRRMESEAEANKAYQAGEITGYYLISKNFLESGEVVYARPDYNPVGGQSDTYALSYTLRYNLVDGDTALLQRLENPFTLEVVSLSQPEARDPAHMLTFFLPYIVMLLFYVVILSTASLMLSSVAIEKQNRMIEILMTSVTPMEMLAGKISALGVAGLVQTVVWSGSGLLMLRLGGTTLNLPEAFQLPVSVLLCGLVFFVLGYILYGSLMAGVGALVPNLREASQATTLVILPMMVPMFLISVLVEEPNGVISMVLSLFPFTAPVAMMTRLAAVSLPFWQPLLAALLLIGTCYLVVRAVAGMFRAQNLLSGQAFNIRLFLSALFGKA
jgi:ABC-2 type transport system permease protein